VIARQLLMDSYKVYSEHKKLCHRECIGRWTVSKVTQKQTFKYFL